MRLIALSLMLIAGSAAAGTTCVAGYGWFGTSFICNDADPPVAESGDDFTYSVVFPGFPICDTCATLPEGHYCAAINSAGGCIDIKPNPNQCKTIAPANQHIFECKVHDGICCVVVGMRDDPVYGGPGSYGETTENTEFAVGCDPVFTSDQAELKARGRIMATYPHDWSVTACWELGPGPHGADGVYGFGYYDLSHSCEKWTNPNPGVSNIGARWTKVVRCRGER